MGIEAAALKQQVLAVGRDVGKPASGSSEGEPLHHAGLQVVTPQGIAVAPSGHTVIGVLQAFERTAGWLALIGLGKDEIVLTG